MLELVSLEGRGILVLACSPTAQSSLVLQRIRCFTNTRLPPSRAQEPKAQLCCQAEAEGLSVVLLISCSSKAQASSAALLWVGALNAMQSTRSSELTHCAVQ